MTYDVVVDGKTHRLELTKGETSWRCQVDGYSLEVDAALTARDVLSVLAGGDAFEVKRERSLSGELHLVIGSARYAIDVQDPRSLRTRRAAEDHRSHAGQDRACDSRRERRGQGRAGRHRNGSNEDAERNEVSQRRED